MTHLPLSLCCQNPVKTVSISHGQMDMCTFCGKPCGVYQGKVEMDAAEREKNIYNWRCQRCQIHVQHDIYENGLCGHCHKERLKIEYDKNH